MAKGMKRIQRGTGEHYLWDIVEDRVEEGGTGGREQEEGPPYPNPTQPKPSPAPSKPTLLVHPKLSLQETGQVRMSGMRVEARCGARPSHIQWWSLGNDPLMLMEENLVLMVCGSQMNQLCLCGKDYTIESFISRWCKWHPDTKCSVLTQNSHTEICNHMCAVQKTQHNNIL